MVYQDVLEEIIRAKDSEEACRNFLRAIAPVLNIPSALIALAHDGQAERLSVIAADGEEFIDLNTQESITGAAISHGWQNCSHGFECAYTSSRDKSPHSFSGFPIYKEMTRHFGFLALPGNFSTPSRLRDCILPTLVSILAHRLNEFDLSQENHLLNSSERMEAIHSRGVRFPSKEDFFTRSTHDVNGALTIASLQTQMLSQALAPINNRGQSFERLLNSIREIETLIEIQEEGTSVLLSSRDVSSFQKCLNVSLATFNTGIRNTPKIGVKWNSEDQNVAVRGIVMHWILHNFLRQISLKAQSCEGSECHELWVEVHRSGSVAQPFLELRLSVELCAEAQEEITRRLVCSDMSDVETRYATSIFGHLYGLTELLGWQIQSQCHFGTVEIDVLVPCVPLKI